MTVYAALSATFSNPFTLVFLILPVITLFLSFIMQLFVKKKSAVLGVVFLAYLIATFTIFNSTFFIWCFVYTAVGFIGTLLADLVLRLKK